MADDIVLLTDKGQEMGSELNRRTTKRDILVEDNFSLKSQTRVMISCKKVTTIEMDFREGCDKA